MTESWPFLGTEAISGGAVTRRALSALYAPVYPGVYAPRGIELTSQQRATAAWLWSRRKAVVSGLSAAAVLGCRWVGVRGLRALRQTLQRVDGGAQFPYESLTRLMLVDGVLPVPQTQLAVRDEYGFAVAYLDMGWREYRVGVEYDGAHHWTDPRQRRRDIERFAALEALGWLIIRVTSDTLRTPASVVARLGAALARGILDCAV